MQLYCECGFPFFKGHCDQDGCGLNGGIDGGLAERIIDQISANNSVTVQEISVALGTPKRTIEREMKRLRDSKRITRVGGNRYGYWEIIG